MQDQLKNVQQIQASCGAFAAILLDGSVVTWGIADYGGDSSSVQHQLKNVQQIQALYDAFAAILGDGSVVTWGSAEYGGDSGALQDQLKNVQQIQAFCGAFAAILLDRSVVTWGGDSSFVQDRLRDVQQKHTCACTNILICTPIYIYMSYICNELHVYMSVYTHIYASTYMQIETRSSGHFGTWTHVLQAPSALPLPAGKGWSSPRTTLRLQRTAVGGWGRFQVVVWSTFGP